MGFETDPHSQCISGSGFSTYESAGGQGSTRCEYTKWGEHDAGVQ